MAQKIKELFCAPGGPKLPPPFSLHTRRPLPLFFPAVPSCLAGITLPLLLPFHTVDYAQITYGGSSRVTPNFREASSGTQLLLAVSQLAGLTPLQTPEVQRCQGGGDWLGVARDQRVEMNYKDLSHFCS